MSSTKALKVKSTATRFQILPDGWIKDNQTGLEWGTSSDNYMDLKEAKKYCKDNGGRLPTRFELEGILDLTKYNPAIDSIFKDAKSYYYLTSTPCVAWKTAYWCVSFYYGGVSYDDGCFGYYVRPVRASQ